MDARMVVNQKDYASHHDVIFIFCDMENVPTTMTITHNNRFSAMNRYKTMYCHARSPVYGTIIDAGKGMKLK